jgi:hypothetical protein
MAKKVQSDRSDPKKNKSLAIRMMLRKMPTAKALDVAEAVKKDYGHDVKQNMVYMVKTKANMMADGRPRGSKTNGGKKDGAPSTAAQWVEAIKIARQLLRATGSAANATALLKAVEG